jgi:hypothetical protein
MTIPTTSVAPHPAKPPAKASPIGTNGNVDPGVSIRFGPVQDKDVDMEDADADAHGVSKRKSRASIDKKKTYAEPESSDDDDQPLVRSTIVANLTHSLPSRPCCRSWFRRLTIR